MPSHTDTNDPEYYLKVVDCQYACPAHTNVPEYIRLVAQGEYTKAYLVNRASNVFPGILGRVCDRPCEPACRRGRLAGEEPVAICRLKRVAADHKEDISGLFQPAPVKRLQKIAVIGAGPASLTVANDLLPLGFDVTLFEKEASLGGAMRRAVPAFRLPLSVLEEEIGYILALGLKVEAGAEITALSPLMTKFDAVFVGTGAPIGRDLPLPGHKETGGRVHIGLHWLSGVAFGHETRIGPEVIVIGGGNTAMDCCRTALRLGAKKVTVVAPEAFDKMLASPWEKDDALKEGVVMKNQLLPLEYVSQAGVLTGLRLDALASLHDEKGQWAPLSRGLPPETLPCTDIILAIGQNTHFRLVDAASGIALDQAGRPIVDADTLQTSVSKVFFGGDCAFGPKNIITAVAHGHKAALSIKAFLDGEAVTKRSPLTVMLESQKMGLHEWSYGNAFSAAHRHEVHEQPLKVRLADKNLEVELGFDVKEAIKEAARCLNCDVQTVFKAGSCIECDSCVDICPTECLTLTAGGSEAEVSLRLSAERIEPGQLLFQSLPLKTGRVMVKDENVCLHCGLCAERCPTGAFDMQKSLVTFPYAGTAVKGCP